VRVATPTIPLLVDVDSDTVAFRFANNPVDTEPVSVDKLVRLAVKPDESDPTPLRPSDRLLEIEPVSVLSWLLVSLNLSPVLLDSCAILVVLPSIPVDSVFDSPSRLVAMLAIPALDDVESTSRLPSWVDMAPAFSVDNASRPLCKLVSRLAPVVLSPSRRLLLVDTPACTDVARRSTLDTVAIAWVDSERTLVDIPKMPPDSEVESERVLEVCVESARDTDPPSVFRLAVLLNKPTDVELDSDTRSLTTPDRPEEISLFASVTRVLLSARPVDIVVDRSLLAFDRLPSPLDNESILVGKAARSVPTLVDNESNVLTVVDALLDKPTIREAVVLKPTDDEVDSCV
jgi:pilus assembly protein FimV